MNHQPFESWLLDDKVLNPTEKRELDSHLRTCKACSALAGTGLALRSARSASPAPGFALRFQQRLAAQKVAERRRRLWGLIVLIFSAVTLLGLFLAPLVVAFVSAPVEWLTATLGYLLFVFTSLQSIGEVAGVFVRMLPSFLPPYAWMVILSGLAGVGLLWIVSIWRFARRHQGVTA